MINSEQTAGFKNIQWNATDNLGQPVSAGVYLYSIETKDFRQTKKDDIIKVEFLYASSPHIRGVFCLWTFLWTFFF